MIDKNNLISDDDPIFDEIDKCFDDCDYDKILKLVSGVDENRRSTLLRFREISALNNLKRFEEAYAKLNGLFPICKTPQEKARYYYMLGYIYDCTNREYKAIELYRNAIKVDPEHTYSGVDFHELIKSSLEYANKDMDSVADYAGKIVPWIENIYSKYQNESVDEMNRYPRMSCAYKYIYHFSNDKNELDINNPFYEFPENEKEMVKAKLNKFGINDLRTLTVFLKNSQLESELTVARGFVHNEPEVVESLKLDEMDEKNKVAWEINIAYAKALDNIFPKGEIYAWTVTNSVGFARACYGCGILNKRELMEAYLFWADQCKQYFSSWKEFALSLYLGIMFYKIRTTEYNIRKSKEIANNILSVVSDVYKKSEWMDVI